LVINTATPSPDNASNPNKVNRLDASPVLTPLAKFLTPLPIAVGLLLVLLPLPVPLFPFPFPASSLVHVPASFTFSAGTLNFPLLMVASVVLKPLNVYPLTAATLGKVTSSSYSVVY